MQALSFAIFPVGQPQPSHEDPWTTATPTNASQNLVQKKLILCITFRVCFVDGKQYHVTKSFLNATLISKTDILLIICLHLANSLSWWLKNWVYQEHSERSELSDYNFTNVMSKVRIGPNVRYTSTFIFSRFLFFEFFTFFRIFQYYIFLEFFRIF